MRITVFFILVFVVINYAYSAAQDDVEIERSKLSPGLETLKVGGEKITIPEGATVSKKGGLIVVEDMSSFAGRKIYELEKNIQQLQAKQEELIKEIEKLKQDLSDLQKNSTVSE